MQAEQPKGPFCQSCGMPLAKPEDFGTNADGSASEDYCCHCYRSGEFTEPDITMQGMIEAVAGFMAQHGGMSEAQAKEMVSAFMPRLKRWQAG